MALVEGCKHSLDFVVPVEDVAAETDRVVAELQKKVKLPGFRPGKAPAGLIQKQFQSDIRQKVLENLLPRTLQQRFSEENLNVVSTPDVTELKFEPGAPLEFTAVFEVAPEIDLHEYTGLTVTYREPDVSDDDIAKRIEDIRERKAEFVNVDPRPLEDGDHALLRLLSLAGVEGQPIEQDEIMLKIGSDDTVGAFSENLRGAAPGDVRVFDVTYPDDYAQERLAGKTVTFQATVKGVRKKELPELNDDFAKDLGDFQSLEELRNEVRKSILAEREHHAQEEAKNALIEKLVDLHDFPVPEAYVDRQIQTRVQQSLRGLAAEGMDVSKLRPDWNKLKEAQQDKATREVKASLLLGKIAERESIAAMRDEVDREVERLAKQMREPVAALKIKMEKDGSLNRIASHIQTQKVLTFLFEKARKEAPEE